MAYKVTVDPTVEPITLQEAKDWLKVSGSAEDSLITMMIESERQLLEDLLNQKLVTQTIIQKVDRFPASTEPLYLEANPVQSITSIVYKDAAGSTDTFSSDKYSFDNSSGRARIYLKENEQWPLAISEKEAVSITYISGYGLAADVPGKLKKLLYHMIGYAYENRMNPVEAKRTYLDRLIANQKIYWFE